MADVAMPAGIGQQVAIIAGLRWRVFRNSLRSTSARFDLLAIVLTTLMGGVFVAGVGVGLGAAAYVAVDRGTPEFLALPFLAVFAFWQFVPFVLAGSATGFDFRNLLRFPLRFPAFFLLSLAYGLFDPVALGSFVMLASIATGISLARPDLLPLALLVLSIFAAANLLLNRAIFSWLERLLARRRSREALVAAFLLVLLSFQLFAAVGPRWEKRLKPFAVAALPALQLFPPGLAANALASAAQGLPLGTAASMAFLVAYGVAFGLLLHRRLRRQYLGEDLGESPVPVTAPAASASSMPSSISWASSVLPGPVAAVLEKEFRYLARNTMAALTLLVPLFLIGFFTFSSSAARRGPGAFTRSPDLVFPGAVAYMFLILAPVAHNCLAYDGRGIQLWFVAPVRFRDVLLGKNLFLGLMLVIETWLVWLLVSFLFRPPKAMIVAAALSGLVFAALVNFIVGNWLSLQFPRRLEFGQLRRRSSGVSMLVSLALQVVVLGLAAVVYLLARWRGQMWLIPVVFLGLSAVALPVYVATLDECTRLALDKREVLTAQLTR